MAVESIELVLTALLLLMLVSKLISLRLGVPYTLVLVWMGVALTAFATVSTFGSDTITSSIQGFLGGVRAVYGTLVQGGLFVGLVVPPLIFEAMVHIEASDLRSVIRPAVILATIGVVVATFVCGLILWQFAGLSIVAAFLFASIIAPTDTVTVLEIFRQAPIPSRLATLMDVEAAFNDATGIVIFSIVLSSLSVGHVSFLEGISRFGMITIGGAAVGILVALTAMRISASFEDKLGELILTITAVYGSYVFATAIGFSGLIAVAIVGLYFGNITLHSTVNEENRQAILSFWEIAAFIGNSVAFLLIGFETNLSGLASSLGLILLAYGAVAAARAISVYPVLAIFSQLGERLPIAWSNVSFIGGVRGALSIALAASLASSTLLSTSDQHTITEMVIGVAFLSITIQVPLLSRYIKRRVPEGR